MVVVINDTTVVDGSDGLNWTLKEKHTATRGKNKGQVTETILGYYASPEQAINSYFRKKLIRVEQTLPLAEFPAFCAEFAKTLFKKGEAK